jgi:hypothetical protein
MPQPKLTPLPIAVRVYPDWSREETGFDRPDRKWRLPEAGLVFDTETRIDHIQRLTFGSYRFIVNGSCMAQNLFLADDLPPEDRRVLKSFVANGPQVNGPKPVLLTRAQFLKKLFELAYKGRCLLVAFNFPFDISRLAFNSSPARRRFAGGFSLDLWSYAGSRNQFRPSICIKQIDSKRALKGFTHRKEPDQEDLIPDGSVTGKPEKDYAFRGHFLDLRTLAFALTDRGHTLESACEEFGVEHGKGTVKRHGSVTKKYIEYNLRDVLATSELAIKLLEEYEKHPISLQVTKAYSPASIGKAYLRAMLIPPILERQPDFPKRYIGHAQSAFFGGRTSAHIRKVAVPVVYTDFLSMYPTVNSLMNLWRFVTAETIQVVEHCQDSLDDFLRQLSAERLFDPATWKDLTGFVQIIPNGDILPSRGQYNPDTKDWQVAINHLYGNGDTAKQALWFSLPDVVASVLLTKKIPKIVDAFRLKPFSQLTGLAPTKLRGMIDVDPAKEDFFRIVIEQRMALPKRTDLSDLEKRRLKSTLKVLANATSYGIYAEMHRLESDRKVQLTCYGIDPDPYPCRVAHPDEAGKYCFPPMASLITGAARLMLALLEHCVTELKGTYAMEDTDSMAIVATEEGGLVPCPGGRLRTKDGQRAIRALTWKRVDEISDRFKKLNPYSGEAGKGSILKIEADNHDPVTADRRQVYCFAISAKRYVLFLKDATGEPSLLRASCPFCGRKDEPGSTICKNEKCRKPVNPNNAEDRWSEHGLGHLLNPIDPESDDRDWNAQAWMSIVRRSLGLSILSGIGFDTVPAVGRLSISSPAMMKPLADLNEGKAYADRIKPFNFLLSCHVKAFGHPLGVDPERFQLISPYQTDSRKWLTAQWIDKYSGKTFWITTTGHHSDRKTVRVKAYGDVLREYEFHAESKCADAQGNISGKQTVGLLNRRHIQIDQIKYIGKESNSLEEVESGMIHSADIVYTEYPDPRRDQWETKILPALERIPPAYLVRECRGAISRRALADMLARRTRPRRKNQQLLAAIVLKLGMT